MRTKKTLTLHHHPALFMRLRSAPSRRPACPYFGTLFGAERLAQAGLGRPRAVLGSAASLDGSEAPRSTQARWPSGKASVS